MSVELSYRIVQLTRVNDAVKMALEEVRLISPEEIKRAYLEAENETDVTDVGDQLQKVDFIPKPKTPTEEMFSAMRSQIPEMIEAFKSRTPDHSGEVVFGPVSISQIIELYLTCEQYEDLGTPSLLSVLKLSIKMET